jgi:hypothetical protein
MELVSTEFLVKVEGETYARVDRDWFKVYGTNYIAVNALQLIELESEFQQVIGE